MINQKEKLNNNIKPFLRWAGGKNWFRKHIEQYIPQKFENYYEPFLGGASIFFYLKSKGLIKNKSYLSDSNKDLINTYRVIKNKLPELKKVLKTHYDSHDEYYRIREQVYEDPIERAAQFLFLNKTSFNGIYRVNRNGRYNVPYGKRNLKTLYDFEHLEQISLILDKTFFSSKDFKDRCKKPKEGDFVFIDPPYTVAHENNGFVQYNQSIFSWQNQIQLSKIVENFDTNNINYLVTNAYHNSIKELYTIGNQKPIYRSSTIGGKGAARKKYKEIIITNSEI